MPKEKGCGRVREAFRDGTGVVCSRKRGGQTFFISVLMIVLRFPVGF